MTFEMWVEIEGKPLEVFAEEESTDGALEAWIASEEGKVSLLVFIVGSLSSIWHSEPCPPYRE